MWENVPPFRQFALPPDSSLLDGHVTFAKVSEEKMSASGTAAVAVSHLAAIQRVRDNIWSLYRLDKGIRMRSVRAIDDASVSLGRQPSTINAYEKHANRSAAPSHPLPDHIANLLVTPTWHDFTNDHIDALMKIDLSIPCPASKPMTPSTELIDPHSFLTEKYHEILYNTTLPLVYFAKSTLSKIRSICKENDTLLAVLTKRVVQISQLDEKYTPTNSNHDDDIHLHWLQSIESESSNEELQNQLSSLKFREIQLQIILLLEILAHNGEDGQSSLSTPSYLLPPTPPSTVPRKSIVRKKKKKPALSKPIAAVEPPSLPASLTYDESLDILFDRLCINEAISSQPTADQPQHKSNNKPDKVQEFCFEIILPFFASRLSDRTKQMLRKARGLSSRSKRKDSSNPTMPPLSPALPFSVDSINSPEPNEANTQQPVPQPTLASKSHSIRGGFLSTKTNQQKRQVDVTFAMKKHQKESIIANELANAIKNIAKPNRSSATEEFPISKPRAVKVHRRRTYTAPPPLPEPTSTLQVPGNGFFATPAKKRTIHLPEFQQSPNIIISTPQKRQKFDETLTSSPSFIASTPSTTRRTLNFDIRQSPTTPIKHITSYDTDDDMMHIE